MKNKFFKRAFAVLSTVLIVFVMVVPASAASVPKELIPGGTAFGIKFFTKGALVLGTTGVNTEKGVVSPAKDCGIKKGDIIIRACGAEFASAEELVSLIESSGGKTIAIVVDRSGSELTLKATPAYDIETKTYRIGIFVRDSAAGIGTVTYIVPGTNEFGGLGHGIYDSETGSILPLGKASTVDVKITETVKSVRESPGELHGSFSKTKTGELFVNSDQGVFGKFTEVPSGLSSPIPVGTRSELKTGKAYIYSTLSEGAPERYEIEIERIYENSESTKNFLIRVTDERLIEKAGGIVRGMSGSPIIMDGKLVGAVTHVLVSDPVHGYGICIENMLSSASEITESADIGIFGIAA